MPRKSKSATKQKTEDVEFGRYYTSNDAPWGGFINIKLDDEQKSSFTAWFESPPVPMVHLLEDALADGLKVSFAYDTENQCHICSFTGALVGGSTERYVVTSRASTFTESMGIALWKHFYLADGDYGNFKPRTGQLNNWG